MWRGRGTAIDAAQADVSRHTRLSPQRSKVNGLLSVESKLPEAVS